MINTQWLATFCKLVETKHFTKTAESLFMTQSGVSQQIKKLEASLNTSLIVKQGKSFYLTDAGERLYDRGQTLVDELSALETIVQQDDPYAGVVRFKSPGSVGLKLYSHLLELQQANPQLIIDHRFAPNHEIIKDVANNELDLGIVTQELNQTDEHQKIDYQLIGHERLQLVTAKGALDQSDKTDLMKVDQAQSSRWKTLQTLGFINHPDGQHHANLLLSANFPQYQNIGQFTLRGFSNQIGLILDPVAAGLGFTVLPEYAIERYPHKDKLDVLDLGISVSEPLYLVSKKNKAQAGRFEVIIQEIKKWL